MFCAQINIYKYKWTFGKNPREIKRNLKMNKPLQGMAPTECLISPCVLDCLLACMYAFSPACLLVCIHAFSPACLHAFLPACLETFGCWSQKRFFCCQAQVQVQVRVGWRSGEGQEGQIWTSYPIFLVFTTTTTYQHHKLFLAAKTQLNKS